MEFNMDTFTGSTFNGNTMDPAALSTSSSSGFLGEEFIGSNLTEKEKTNALPWHEVFHLLGLGNCTLISHNDTDTADMEELYYKSRVDLAKSSGREWVTLLRRLMKSVQHHGYVVCSVPDEDNLLYSSYSDNEETYYVAALTVIVAIGIIGNCMQLFLMSHASMKNLSYTVYLKSLAVIDTLVLLHVATEDYMDYRGRVDSFLSSSIHVCRFWNWLTLSTRHISPWLVVALTVERCIAVALPLQRKNICTVKAAVIVSAMIFIIFIILPFIHVIPVLRVFTESIDGNRTESFCEMEYVSDFFQVDILFIMTALPCILILILNVFLSIKLRSSFKARQKLQRCNTNQTTANTKNPSPEKTAITLFAVSMLSLVTLSPKAIIESKEHLREDVTPLRWWRAVNCIEMMNFALNFYVMMLTGRTYRITMKDQLSRLAKRVRSCCKK